MPCEYKACVKNWRSERKNKYRYVRYRSSEKQYQTKC